MPVLSGALIFSTPTYSVCLPGSIMGLLPWSFNYLTLDEIYDLSVTQTPLHVYMGGVTSFLLVVKFHRVLF